MPRVLLFGYYGFGNIGDELLAASILQNLPEYDFTIVSNDPAKTRQLHGVEAISRKQFWKDPGPFEILLFGGGGLLQNATSNRSLIYYLGAIQRAKSLGMDVYLMAQGLGPFRKSLLKPLWRFGFRTLKGIPLSVRDKHSREIAGALGLDAELVADPALLYNSYPKRDLARQRSNIIGIAPKKGFNLKTLSWLGEFESGTKVHLFAFHKEDLEVCLELERSMKNVSVFSIDGFSDLAYLAEVDLLWGMRLHSMIAAAKMGIPAIGISYDPKVRSFCDEAGYICHKPTYTPKKEWVQSAEVTELIKRAKRSWDLFRAYAKGEF